MDYELIGFEDFPSKKTLLKAKIFNKMDCAIKYLCDKEKESSEDVARLKSSAQKAEKRLDALETFVPGSAAFEVGTEKKVGNIKMGNANYVHYRKYFRLEDNEDNSTRRFKIPFDDTSAEKQEEEPPSVMYLFDVRGTVGFKTEGLTKFPIGCYSGNMQSNVSYDCADKEIIITLTGARACEPITVAGYIDYLRA